MLKYAKICCANSLEKNGVPANFYAFCISVFKIIVIKIILFNITIFNTIIFNIIIFNILFLQLGTRLTVLSAIVGKTPGDSIKQNQLKSRKVSANIKVFQLGERAQVIQSSEVDKRLSESL